MLIVNELAVNDFGAKKSSWSIQVFILIKLIIGRIQSRYPRNRVRGTLKNKPLNYLTKLVLIICAEERKAWHECWFPMWPLIVMFTSSPSKRTAVRCPPNPVPKMFTSRFCPKEHPGFTKSIKLGGDVKHCRRKTVQLKMSCDYGVNIVGMIWLLLRFFTNSTFPGENCFWQPEVFVLETLICFGLEQLWDNT